jgi:hypothetical protein
VPKQRPTPAVAFRQDDGCATRGKSASQSSRHPRIPLVDDQRTYRWSSVALKPPFGWKRTTSKPPSPMRSALAVMPLTTANKPAENPQEGQLEFPEGTES